MNQEETLAKLAREWNNNQCEGCFSPLRDCVCELCEVCEALVTQCDCNRCEDCGTIYSGKDSEEKLNDDGNCLNCADSWSCGACGEICEIEDGTVSSNQGFMEFTHKAELCSAQDEIGE